MASVGRDELDQTGDMSRDLKPNSIKRYGEYFETLILTITETMNPFSLDLKQQLNFFFISLRLE